MNSRSSLSMLLMITLVLLIISDCKKKEEDIPYSYQYHPCTYANSVWIGMMIYALSPGNGDFVPSTSVTITWRHPVPGLINGSNGLTYEVYLGYEPGSLLKITSVIINDSTTISGLNLNQTYYWKVIAKYNWLDSKGAKCSNTTETETMSFITYQKADLPSVITAPVQTHNNTPPRVGGKVLFKGSSELIERGVYWSQSPNPESTGIKFQIGNSIGLFSNLLPDIIPATTYYLRAYANNSYGSTLGSVISFTTGQNTAYQSVTDIDGNLYYTVKIGKQTWMAENLRTTRYNDGTPIYLNYNTTNSTIGYAWYNNDKGLSSTYGALYKGFTIDTLENGKKNVCPTGWYVPSDTDWKLLIAYLGGEDMAGGRLKDLGVSFWNFPNNTTENNNDFSALPAGQWDGSVFLDIGKQAYWWSTTKEQTQYGIYPRYVWILNNKVNAYMSTGSSGSFLSVRCIKN